MDSTAIIQIDDAVDLPGDKFNIVKLIGELPSKIGVFVDVEPDTVSAGKGKSNRCRWYDGRAGDAVARGLPRCTEASDSLCIGRARCAGVQKGEE